jgi:hypothetical protein
MTKPTTQGERLMKIETLLEAKAEADHIHDQAMLLAIDDVRSDVKAIRKDLDDDKAELERLKNRGAGILIGVAIAAGGIGAGFSKFWQWLAGIAS